MDTPDNEDKNVPFQGSHFQNKRLIEANKRDMVNNDASGPIANQYLDGSSRIREVIQAPLRFEGCGGGLKKL
ncbi:hypothetical protein HC928_25230 [bacterium]|nr:hypothetical protein [bacterium]